MDGNPIVVAGDWHGNVGWARQVIRSGAYHGARTILQVGDFGALWPGKLKGRFEARLNYYLQQHHVQLIFIGGNHDNWAELQEPPVGADGLAPLLSNIKYPPRPGRTTVNGLTVGGLGGAFSVDYQYRVESKDWWAEEDLTTDDVEQFVRGGSVDVLLTYDVPADVPVASTLELPDQIVERANRTRTLLGEAIAAVRPPHVFCGHWHQRVTTHLSHVKGPQTRVDVLHTDGSVDGNAVLLRRTANGNEIDPLIVRVG